MSLNKYAGWGKLPAGTLRKSSALPGRLADIAAPLSAGGATLALLASALGPTGTLAGRLDAINTAIGKLGPWLGATPLPVVSQSAFLIVWALNSVRDALCDQKNASAASTNQQLKAQAGNARVKQFGAWLKQHYPNLAPGFDAQYRPLSGGAKSFEVERRARLVELAAFEGQVMTTVGDTGNVLPIGPGAYRVRGAAKP